jgi:hypothetical protein
MHHARVKKLIKVIETPGNDDLRFEVIRKIIFQLWSTRGDLRDTIWNVKGNSGEMYLYKSLDLYYKEYIETNSQKYTAIIYRTIGGCKLYSCDVYLEFVYGINNINLFLSKRGNTVLKIASLSSNVVEVIKAFYNLTLAELRAFEKKEKENKKMGKINGMIARSVHYKFLECASIHKFCFREDILKTRIKLYIKWLRWEIPITIMLERFKDDDTRFQDDTRKTEKILNEIFMKTERDLLLCEQLFKLCWYEPMEIKKQEKILQKIDKSFKESLQFLKNNNIKYRRSDYSYKYLYGYKKTITKQDKIISAMKYFIGLTDQYNDFVHDFVHELKSIGKLRFEEKYKKEITEYMERIND